MKTVFSALVMTLIASSAFAAQVQVPDDKLPMYKQAVEFALTDAKLNCMWTSGLAGNFELQGGQKGTDALKALIDQSTSATLDESGDQPVLSFHYDSYYVEDISIVTSSDYKSVVAVNYSQYSTASRQVNAGTIVNPNIITQTYKTNSYTALCK